MADYKDALRDLGLDERTIEAIQDLNDEQISGSIAYATDRLDFCDCDDCEGYTTNTICNDLEKLQTYYLRTEGFIK